MAHKGSVPQVPGTHQTFIDSYKEVSNKTPGWALRKKRKLELPVTPYFFSAYRGQSTIAHYPPNPIPYYDVTDYDLPVNGWDDFCRNASDAGQPKGFLGVDVLTENRIAVSNDLRNQATDVDIDVGVALAEATQTMDLVSSACRTIVKTTLALLSGQPRKAADIILYGGSSARTGRELTRQTRDAWLAWSYGVKPLMADVAGAVENCRSHYAKGKKFQFYSARRQTIDGFSFTNQGYPSERFAKVSGDLTVKGKIIAKIKDPVEFKSGKLGLNVSTTLWELVPYSFVVDWFIPIGDWIRNADPISGLEFVRGWVTAKGQGVLSRTTHTGYGTQTVSSGTYLRYKQRWPLPGFPDFRLPSPTWAQSIEHCISGLALLSQPFDKGSSSRRVR